MARTAEQVREAKRVYMAQKRAADPDAMRAYGRRYHAINREARTAKMREYYARRFFWARAMKLRGEDRATPSDLWRIWKAQRGRCALTGRLLDRTAQVDHVHPKAKGGPDHAGNLRWVCAEVNLAKRDMTDDQWFSLCSDAMRWIGRRIEAVDAVGD